MKTTLTWLAAILLLIPDGQAQTADTYVSQGRAFLVAHDLASADARFALAVATAPAHAEANAFRAVTRLLVLQNTPAGAALLDRLGVAASGRDIYNWTADVARDINGVPLVPANMSAAELSAFIRTNLLIAIKAASSNLAVVTNTAFLLNLTSAETAAVAVTLDYGDVTLARAGLKFAEYAAYTVCSWNLDAQLETIRAAIQDEVQTPEAFLAAHPNLLRFATTNDLNAAKQAFSEAVSLYSTASAFIRNRPSNVTRLFNLDPGETQSETDFRTTLNDLMQSLNGTVALQISPQYSVNLSNHFSGRTSMRALLPQVAGKSIVAGTVPDETFGGIFFGVENYQIENQLAQACPFISKLGHPVFQPDGSVEIPLWGIEDGAYLLQTSLDLEAWDALGPVIIQQGRGSYFDWPDPEVPRFYRVLDLSSEVVVQGTVRDLATLEPLFGVPIQIASYIPYFPYNIFFAGQTDEAGNYQVTLPSYFADLPYFSSQVTVAFPGYGTKQYFSAGQHFSQQIYLVPNGYVQPNDLFAQRTTLAGQSNVVLAANINATKEANEPNHDGRLGGKSLWWTWTAPANGSVTIDTSGSDFDTLLAVYTGNSLVTLLPIVSNDNDGGKSTSRVTFTASSGTTYQLAVDGFFGAAGVIKLNLRQSKVP